MNTPEQIDTDPTDTSSSRASRLWRSVWRTHFYAGLIAAPLLVLMALTGLVILYTEPINEALDGNLTTVAVGANPVSLDLQLESVKSRYPNTKLVAVTPPKEPGLSTRFKITKEDETSFDVFVNPYTGDVLGAKKPGSGVVGLANRLHGNLNNEAVTIPVPTVAGLLGPDPLFAKVAVGDVAIEILAGWGLILAFTGAYLWWPRKKGTGRALFIPRFNKPGRPLWRDLHAVGGTLLAFLLIFFVTTGLPWSGAWGLSWGFIAEKITPNAQTSFWEWEGPKSAIPVVGDLDRQGNRIPWASGQDQVPTSDDSVESTGVVGLPHHGSNADSAGSTPAEPASLDLIASASNKEGMLPGYTINAPVNVLPDPKNPDAPTEPFFGAYVVFNPWPSDMSSQGGLYLDQFSGKTLGKSTAETWGILQWATEFGVQTHMGTQFGLFNRIVMTAGCLLLFWNVFTAITMWNKRRRSHSMGLPRRPVDVRLQRVLGITACVLGVIYPLWGFSLVLVLLLDRYLIRRRPKLREAFGMR